MWLKKPDNSTTIAGYLTVGLLLLSSFALISGCTTLGTKDVLCKSDKALSPSSPLARPDLQIDYMLLDEGNFLIVAISNKGSAEVPAGIGNLSVFVDHVHVSEFKLGNLASQTYRDVGGQTVIHTGVRVYGSKRRVLAHVDSGHAILEENEYQNSMSLAFDSNPMTGYDFDVKAWVGEDDLLRMTVVNVGDITSPDDYPIDVRVYLGGQLNISFKVNLRSLPPDGITSENFAPPTPVSITMPTPVRVTVRGASETNELDHVNNIFAGDLYHVELADIDNIYADLLGNPLIRNNLCWRSATGDVCYDNWSVEMKDRLKELLLLLEQGRRLPMDGPPPIMEYQGNDYKYITPADAREIYMMHVAQSLWFDKQGITNWNIADLDSTQLAYLFTSYHFIGKVMQGVGNEQLYYFSSFVMGAVTPGNPQAVFDFMRQHGMIRPTQEETVTALLDWFRAHVQHASASEEDRDTAQRLNDYRGYIPVDRIIYPLESADHVAWGCWGTSGFIAAALRTVNIPVIHGRTEMASTFDGAALSHSRFELPTVRRSPAEDPGIAVFHSDDLYSGQWLLFGTTAIPSLSLFFNYSEISRLIDNPVHVDVRPSDGQPNTPQGQATQNNGRYKGLLAREYMPGWYLRMYNVNTSYLDESLRGIHFGGLQEFALPFLNDTERAEFLQAAQMELENLGDGNYSDGVADIDRLQRNFSNRRPPTAGAPADANRPPVFSWVRDVQVSVNDTVAITLTATDPEGGPVDFLLPSPPPGSSLNGNVFEWSVGENIGTHELVFQAKDANGGVAQLDVVVVVSPATPSLPKSGLVAWYRLNGDMLDSSGNGHTALNLGVGFVPDRFGYSNRALGFDGQNGFIVLPNEQDFDMPEFTMVLAMKLDQPADQNGWILSKGFRFGNFTLRHIGSSEFWPGYAEYVHQTLEGNWSSLASAQPLPHDRFFCWAVSLSLSEFNSYLDGQRVRYARNPSVPRLNDNAVLVGAGGYDSASGFFSGIVDELLIYRKALSGTQVGDACTYLFN